MVCLSASKGPLAVIGRENFWFAVEGREALLKTETASKFLNWEGDITS